MPAESTVTSFVEILTHAGAVGGGGVGTLMVYKYLFNGGGKNRDSALLIEQQKTNQQLSSLERTTQEGFKDLNSAILTLALNVNK